MVESTPANDQTISQKTPSSADDPAAGAFASPATAAPGGGQSGSEPSPLSASRGKRSNEFWLALVNSVVVLVVAVSAIGLSFYASAQRDKQETTRENSSSARMQQRDAYAGFINSASDLAIAVQYQVKAIENQYPYFLHSPISEVKADLEKKFTDLGHALDVAQLYGGAHVRDESVKVFDAAKQSRFVIIGWNMSHPANSPDVASCAELLVFEEKTESNRQQLGNAIDQFNDAARADLGISPLPPTSTPPEPLLPKDVCAPQ